MTVQMLDFAKALGMAVVGFPIVMIMARVVRKYMEQRIGGNAAMLLRHSVLYGGSAVLLLMILPQLGFKVSALLGAAGIFGVAVGFASQTSMANVISGVFLLMERSLKVGDFVVCSGVMGKVESIDLLSLSLRTTDGRLIRVPNELIIKNIVTNNSFYSKRRLTFEATIPRSIEYQTFIEDLKRVSAESDLIKKDPALQVVITEVLPWATKLSIRFWINPREISKASAEFMQMSFDLLGDNKEHIAIVQK